MPEIVQMMISPPSAGPATEAVWNPLEDQVIALPKCRSGTVLVISAALAGMRIA